MKAEAVIDLQEQDVAETAAAIAAMPAESRSYISGYIAGAKQTAALLSAPRAANREAAEEPAGCQ